MKIDVQWALPCVMTLVVGVGSAAALAAANEFVSVKAAYEASKAPGTDAAIAVTFETLKPKIVINENPAPRLRLDEGQQILDDRQPPSKPGPPPDPANAKYLDLEIPVRFAVAPREDAPKGEHSVDATVTYFFCSKLQNWCRKGQEKVTINVTIP